MARTFERVAEGAPIEQPRPTPGSEAIKGVLRAMQDQTSSFDWRNFLLAVARRLDLPDNEGQESTRTFYLIQRLTLYSYQPFPSTVLEGLITVLASVQRFCEDRMVIIELGRSLGTEGLCIIVVWAHHVLGLSVLVNLDLEGQRSQTKFGSRTEQVVIVAGNVQRLESSITLLTKGGDSLFCLREERDDHQVLHARKRPARGFAKLIFQGVGHIRERRRERLPGQHDQEIAQEESFVREFAFLTLAFTMLWCRKLCVRPQYVRHDANWSGRGDPVHLPYNVSDDELLGATRLLFHDMTISTKEALDYVDSYSGMSLANTLEPPNPILKMLETWPNDRADKISEVWDLCHRVITVSLFVFAFAHILDIEKASGLPLFEDIESIYDLQIYRDLCHWDGRDTLELAITSSFDIVSSLMLGEAHGTDMSRVSLVSSQGWSIYLTSISEADPIHIGTISIFLALQSADKRFGQIRAM